MNNIYQSKILCFLAFIKNGNILKAASEIGISGPAMTKQLQKFDEDFEMELFLQDGRKKRPTKFAINLYNILLESSIVLDRKIKDLNAQSYDEKQLTIKVGVRKELMEKVYNAFDFEGKLELIALSSSESIEMLEKREIDLVITSNENVCHNLIRRPIFEGFSRIAVHKNLIGNLNLSNWYSNKKFYQNDAIFYKHRPPYFNEWCDELGIEFKEIHAAVICEDWNMVVKLIQEEKGFSIIPSGIEILDSSIIVYDIPKSVIPAVRFNMYYHQEIKKHKILLKVFNNLYKNLTLKF